MKGPSGEFNPYLSSAFPVIAAGLMADADAVRGVKGDSKPPAPIVEILTGRNKPCPCGSGKKYKRCCRP